MSILFKKFYFNTRIKLYYLKDKIKKKFINKEIIKYKNNLIQEISRSIFWDVKTENLDYDRNKEYIIERVYTRGNQEDEILLWKIYSYYTLKKIIPYLDGLDDITISYLSIIFNIKKEKFTCYGKKLSYLKY
jgi:hypothetical protein